MPNSEQIFVDLVESILSQQLSGKAANTIITRVKNVLVDITPNRILDTEDRILRECGVSGQKTTYLKDLAAKVMSGQVLLDKLKNLTDEEVITHLTQIKGIGRWTSEMILIFTLDRPDVFPVDDLGIQNAMIKKYGLKKTKLIKNKMLKIAKGFAPNRTAFTKSLWKYLDNR